MRLIQAITGSAFLIFSGLCCAAKYIAAAIKGGNISFSYIMDITPTVLSAAMYGTLFIGLVLIIMSLGIMDKSEENGPKEEK